MTEARPQLVTRIEANFLKRLVRHALPLSRHSIPPHDVRTGRRLERMGLVAYPDDGCFRLTDAGHEWARFYGHERGSNAEL